MHFLIIAKDGTDDEALERRMAARQAHLDLGDQLVAAGQLLYATAILDDDAKMIGSMEVVDFTTREDVDVYLTHEPYVTGDVWKSIEVMPCRPGPAFMPDPS